MTPQEFANKIRTKYPNAYNDISDDELTNRVLKKYPEYISQVKSVTVEQPVEQETFKLPGQETTQSLATGVGKGVLSTTKGIATLGKKITTGLGSLVGIKESVDTTPVIGKLEEMSKPQGTAEQIGYGAEKLAEFFLPAGKTSQAEKAITLLSKGIKSPVLSSVARIGGKSAVQGVSGGTVSLAQTGDIKEAGETALTAGVARGGLATIGEGARALKLPERLYSTIFKNSAKDMISELKEAGINTLRQNNPAKYDEFVKSGIIKVDKLGNPIVNETLAEQALDKGLRGSIRNMADEVVNGTLESESKVQNIAQNYKGTVNLTEPQIKNVLSKIATDYEDVGFGEISNQAKTIVNAIESSNGNVSADIALKAKRLLDKVRISTSFDKPTTSLSQTQGNLKTLSDVIRGRVNNIPGMGETMQNYSFYIDALEALGKEAARRGNNQVIGLIDSVFLAGGVPVDPVVGGTISVLQKVLRSPGGMTRLAQFINQSNLGTKASGVLTSGSAGVQSSLTGQ